MKDRYNDTYHNMECPCLFIRHQESYLYFDVRLSFTEHFQYIWAGMSYNINAMVQIITKSLNKPLGY